MLDDTSARINQIMHRDFEGYLAAHPQALVVEVRQARVAGRIENCNPVPRGICKCLSAGFLRDHPGIHPGAK